VQSLPVTFTARPLKKVLLLLGSSLFVAGGIWLLPHKPFIGGVAIIFFGLGLIVCAVGLLPKSSFLTLTEEGFTVASLYRKHFVSWSSVQSFTPIRIGRNMIVGWNYSPEFRESTNLRKVNFAISEVEAALPDTYGKSAEELCALMNEIKKQRGV
jgi:hypothetical protein